MSKERYLLRKYIQSRISYIMDTLLKNYKEGKPDATPQTITFLQGALSELREIERICEERGRY